MQTPASRDPSKRMSRLHSSSFSNPFKRRGSNAAFVTPSDPDFVCQQLDDIGFPETEIVIRNAPTYSKPPAQWPPRKPLPRSTTESSLARPISRMPDSPTGHRRQATDGPMPLSRRPSRIPTPSRLSPAKSPVKAEPAAFSTPQVQSRRERSFGQPPSSFKPPANVVDTQLTNIDLDPVGIRRSRTIANRPASHRLSSYDVVVHQLLKPKDSAIHELSGGVPLNSSPAKSDPRRQLIVLPAPAQTQELGSPVRGAASRCLSGSPVKYQPKSPPPLLPLIVASPPFDPTLNFSRLTPTKSPSEEEVVTVRQYRTVDLLALEPVDTDVSPTVQKAQPTLRHVYHDQPSAYWTGRFIALNDRLMTEARDVPDPRDDDGISKMLHLEVDRAKHIFRLLEEDCQNREAKDSLISFKRNYAQKRGIPSLLPPGPAGSKALIKNEKDEIPDWRSLSSASTLSPDIESPTPDKSKGKARLQLQRMTSNMSTDSEPSVRIKENTVQKSFMQRILGT